MVLFQATTPTPTPDSILVTLVPVFVGLIAAVPGIVSLLAQLKKDKEVAGNDRAQIIDQATQHILDQYQEELTICRDEREDFATQRAQWESERRELSLKLASLHADKIDQQREIERLTKENESLKAELVKIKLEIKALKGE